MPGESITGLLCYLYLIVSAQETPKFGIFIIRKLYFSEFGILYVVAIVVCLIEKC